MKTYLVNVNGSAGAFVSVPAQLHARRVEIVEDESVVPQGLDYNLPSDNFVATFRVSPGSEPLILGNAVANSNNEGPILAHPAYNSGGQAIAATNHIKLRSATVTATVVRVTEYE